MSDNCSNRFVRHPDAIFRLCDNETVILSPTSAEAYVTNRVGTKLWELLSEERTANELVEAMCGTFQVDENVARRDCQGFLDDLKRHDLILSL